MTSTGLLTPVDAEVVDLLDEAAAKKLDTRIRLTIGTVRENFAKLQDYVHEAKAGEIHRALGFKSWTAYLSDALGAQPLMVDREQRRELVEYLSSEGMSTRAIASATGSSRETVRRQVAGDPNVSPENRESPTTGLDGKTYAPKPRPVAEPVADDRFISSDELDELNRRNASAAVEPASREKDSTKPYDINAALLASFVDTAQSVVNAFLVNKEDPINRSTADSAATYRQLLAEAIAHVQKLDQKLALRENADGA
ncbi:hypothetical protein EN35_16485 [Rhodococcus qingshengii]|nr:hypothetical protein EN35_16485 [Rhodococcus qingshengii]